ncbi:uncharacterized protein LOC117572238 [Drosophila albomicans]|uniref:Uncharacterized protein LOC117572238 n=1 Tax=Drosophila albomicans TaxID=7291 RepID=A0A6P8Z193_DROAB|nr:uncharacterized protein LOC117572238 [Drosophila albomicans]
MSINLVFLIGLSLLITLSQLQYINARSLATKVNLTNQNNAIRMNTTEQQNENNQTKSLAIFKPISSNALTHIVRKTRETEVNLAVDFNTMHQHCDLDQNRVPVIIDMLMNHCIEIYNKRYESEGYYRLYKTFQLEAFFFGQYYERIKRFEVNPHSWDYSEAYI